MRGKAIEFFCHTRAGQLKKFKPPLPIKLWLCRDRKYIPVCRAVNRSVFGLSTPFSWPDRADIQLLALPCSRSKESASKGHPQNPVTGLLVQSIAGV